MPIPPLKESHNDREQIPPRGGRNVLLSGPLTGLAVGSGFHDALGDEFLEASRENCLGYPRMHTDLIEATHTVEKLPEHQQGPLVAHDTKRRLHRAVLGADLDPRYLGRVRIGRHRPLLASIPPRRYALERLTVNLKVR